VNDGKGRWRSYRDIADAIFADQSGADQGSEARKQSGAPPVLDNVADRMGTNCAEGVTPSQPSNVAYIGNR
jgi:hypothetical protein